RRRRARSRTSTSTASICRSPARRNGGRMSAAADPHVATRTFAGIEVSVMRTAVLHWPPEFPPGQDWESPEAGRDEQGRAVVDVLGMVVRTANEVVVVDPG